MPDVDGARLAELLASMSLATDLGNGFPAEKTLRNTWIALGIADELQLDVRERRDLYYASLLRFVGCTAFTHELARVAPNEFEALQAFAAVDDTRPAEAMHAVLSLGRGTGPVRRARTVVANAAHGKRISDLVVRADCEANARFAVRFALGPRVATVLEQAYERWDGRGAPRGLAGDAIEIGARVMAVAHQVEIFHRLEGDRGVEEMVQRRAGGWFDPSVVAAFRRRAGDLLERVATGSVWDEVLASEREPPVMIRPSRLEDAVEAFADFVDLKSPYLLGHSRGVAVLATAAATAMGLGDEDVSELRRAALLHDLGRVGVSNAVWDKPGSLSPSEREAVRLHPYHSERILSHTPLLAAAGRLAGLHHERLDGSGYHRGAAATALSVPARILAAADVYQALTERRPYRPAFAPDRAAVALMDEVAAGRLDRDAAHAVCEGAGHPPKRRRSAWPSGLTDREVDVLRLLAEGRSKKEIARALVLSPGTVHTHVAHIYEKVGVSTRAGVALFAMENDLVRRR